MRGLKKTLIAGTVLINVRPATANSANRSTESPPPRPPPPAPPRPPRPPPPAGSPNVIEPVIPTEKLLQLWPENGNEKFFRAAWLPFISGPNSESHWNAVFSARYLVPSGVKRNV